jgi:hypothetical protein
MISQEEARQKLERLNREAVENASWETRDSQEAGIPARGAKKPNADEQEGDFGEA